MVAMKDEIAGLVKWIREFVHGAGKDGVTLGLSGGVDSAVVAALAVRALGHDNVNVLAMPIRSDPRDLEDAERVSQHLGLGTVSVYDLNVAFDVLAMSLDLEPTAKRGDMVGDVVPKARSLALGNIKARLRMIAVYNEAALCNHLVIGTGNKSELMVGYITKWGDGACDFEPLGEFYKTEVVEMARELGLPEDICSREPSPGLEPGVTDRTELGGGYDEIDPILMAISDGRNYYYGEDGFDQNFGRVMKLCHSADHKKKMPPAYRRVR